MDDRDGIQAHAGHRRGPLPTHSQSTVARCSTGK